MKWKSICLQTLRNMSPPSRAAWIEIVNMKYILRTIASPPSRAAWIEIVSERVAAIEEKMSPPSRAAWIEIIQTNQRGSCRTCRRLHGRRGLKCCVNLDNLRRTPGRRLHGRRGLKSYQYDRQFGLRVSPPSRAAWIEIILITIAFGLGLVAAFTGGVD